MSQSYETLRGECLTTLDRLHTAARAGLTAPAVMAMIERAEAWRRSAPQAWRDLVGDVFAHHPLVDLAARCPFTERARSKPRGYAGDAVMLDYIYDREQVAETRLQGADRAVFRTVIESPTCASVEYRRHLIAERVNRLAAARCSDGRGPISLLSLACGHARELELVRGLDGERVARSVMCDQDGESLAALAQRYPLPTVQPHALTVRQFLARATPVLALGRFDFVYSAGLYDYLEQATAVQLTRVLFEHVAPGGQLLLANFHPSNPGTGYMEAFMDWWLIYRDEARMVALAEAIPEGQVARSELELDPFGNVVYLTLTRA